MSYPIYDITPFTLLDFPGKVACILWFTGCNMRCAYCYNPDIVRGKGRIGVDEALHFLQSRQKLLQGVVLSGGECTLHQDVFVVLERAKQLGLATKVDTNGSRPEVLSTLLDGGLLDYVALDFKSLEYAYPKITGSSLFQPFRDSLSLLIASGVALEVRTTVHSALMNVEDIRHMIALLERDKYHGDYYLQYFLHDKTTIGNLGRSTLRLDAAELSTEAIQVMLRNDQMN